MTIYYTVTVWSGDRSAQKVYSSWRDVEKAVEIFAKNKLAELEVNRVTDSIYKGPKGSNTWAEKGNDWQVIVCRNPDDDGVFIPGKPLLEKDPTCPSR